MKDIFTRNEYIEFKGFKFTFFNIPFEAACKRTIKDFNMDLSEDGIPVEVSVLSDYDDDTYELDISYAGKVYLKATSIRSFNYAIKTLSESIVIQTNSRKLQIKKIIDQPDFKLRGIIEGFYGTPYDFTKRKDIIAFASKHRYNSYFYAPKSDLYHRENWRILYPDEELNALSLLNDYAQSYAIDFYYCISPGLDFNYEDKQDDLNLINKIEQLKSIGIKRFALLMDDLPLNKDTDLNLLAYKHSMLANRLNKYLDDSILYFCPTDYHQNFNTPYREVVKKTLDKDIRVFWTGYNTVAEKIDLTEAIKVNTHFDHHMVLWDNYPVNDFNPKSRVYLGPIKNRSKKLSTYHEGYVTNPSSLWYLSKLSLVSIARYIDDAYTYNDANIIEDMVDIYVSKDSNEKEALKNFIKFNESSVLGISQIDHDMKQAYEKEDFELLDLIYHTMADTAHKLLVFNHEPLLNEMRPYLEYMLNEVVLYQQLKSGKIDKKLFNQMVQSTVRISNQEILHYIIKHQMVKGDYVLEAERINYWAYQSTK